MYIFDVFLESFQNKARTRATPLSDNDGKRDYEEGKKGSGEGKPKGKQNPCQDLNPPPSSGITGISRPSPCLPPYNIAFALLSPPVSHSIYPLHLLTSSLHRQAAPKLFVLNSHPPCPPSCSSGRNPTRVLDIGPEQAESPLTKPPANAME